MRGAPDWHCGLAALLVSLCLLGSLGVSLAPIGWVCAAGFCLLLDRDDDAAQINAIALIAVWSVLQGGAGIGALIALLTLAGTIADSRRFDATVRRKAVIAACACIFGALQLHALPWHAYGAHALYLDSLLRGADRERVWSNGMGVASIGFGALLVVAGWYGVRRRANTADALVFFSLLVLALVDARNVPYLGIAGAPIVADAVASYYVNERRFPVGTVRQYFVTFAAAATAFIATLTVTEPKISAWPAAAAQPSGLLRALNAAGGSHRVLCTTPSWCDGEAAALLDDRSGIADANAHRVQVDVASATGPWRTELRRFGIDAVIADKDDDVAVLLQSTGWHEAASDDSRVLLRPESVR
jgi:type IV secretory pathway TrbD component